MAAPQATATLRIADSETDGAKLSTFWGPNPAKVALGYSASVTVQAPDTLTGTVTVLTSADGVAFATLQQNGTDVEIPAGKTTVLPPFTAHDMMLVSDAAEAADRDFFVTIQEDMS